MTTTEESGKLVLTTETVSGLKVKLVVKNFLEVTFEDSYTVLLTPADLRMFRDFLYFSQDHPL